MNYLIDTNILIWYVEKNPMLPDKLNGLINDPKNISVVSIITLWEIGIKHSLKKIDLKKPLKQLFYELHQSEFIEILDLKPEHIVKSAELPFHHRDPFDRLIYAQSIVENLEFLYSDKIFDLYRGNHVP